MFGKGQPKWVSVKDRLPNEDGKYLVCAVWRHYDETQDKYKPSVFIADVDSFTSNNVTHWLDWDIPEFPEDWWEIFKQIELVSNPYKLNH